VLLALPGAAAQKAHPPPSAAPVSAAGFRVNRPTVLLGDRSRADCHIPVRMFPIRVLVDLDQDAERAQSSPHCTKETDHAEHKKRLPSDCEGM
jgi:hypothetical protein